MEAIEKRIIEAALKKAELIEGNYWVSVKTLPKTIVEEIKSIALKYDEIKFYVTGKHFDIIINPTIFNKTEKIEIGNDFVDLSILNENQKTVFEKALENNLWILLYGKSGIGKTYILEELRKKDFILILGTATKKEEFLQLFNLGFNKFAVDELDKINRNIITVLNALYEKNVQVVATANDLRKIPNYILDRFDVRIEIDTDFEKYKEILGCDEETARKFFEKGYSIRRAKRIIEAGLTEYV